MSKKPVTKKLKIIPRFGSEAEERRFWQTHDSTATWIGRRPNQRALRSSSPPRKRFRCVCRWPCSSESESRPTSATFRISR